VLGSREKGIAKTLAFTLRASGAARKRTLGEKIVERIMREEPPSSAKH
jgi:hypothetical protein